MHNTKILWTRAIINAIGIYKFIKLEIHAPLQTQQNIILLDISKIWLRKYIQQILFLRSSYEHNSSYYIAISFSGNFVKSIWINKGLYFSIFGQSQTYKTCLPGLIIYVSCFDLFCIFCWNQISHTISHRVYSWNGITEVSTLDKLLCSFIHTIDKHIFVFFNYCFC